MRSAELRSDVYVRLAEGKFVKVLHMKDRFDLQEYERFRAKNIDALYLPRKEFLELIQDLLAKIEGVNKDIQKVPLDEIIDTSMAVFQIVHLAIESDGFTPQLQSLTQECVKLAVGTIAKNPTLSELLSRFDKDRDSYLAWHSTALSFMVCKLAVVMGWESEATFYKLSLSALLHDLLLPTDELSKIQSIAELEKSNLPEEKAESFLRHPVDAGKLLQNMNNVPGDVAFIIEQHHELPEGTGFPRGIGYKDISAISALFIIAHDAVATMYASPPEKFSYPQFLKLRKIEKIYAKGSFWQVFSKLIANKDI